MKIYRYTLENVDNLNWWKEWTLNLIDTLLYLATLPFVQLFSLAVGCYLSLSKAKKQTYVNWWKTLTMDSTNEKWIKGPCLFLLSLLFLPLGLAGFLIWVIMCKIGKKSGVSYVVFGDDQKNLNFRDNFKFVSGNLLLGPEFLGKMQNLPDVHRRLLGTAKSLSMQETRSYEPNCDVLEDTQVGIEAKRDSVIIEKWPEDVDFVGLKQKS